MNNASFNYKGEIVKEGYMIKYLRKGELYYGITTFTTEDRVPVENLGKFCQNYIDWMDEMEDVIIIPPSKEFLEQKAKTQRIADEAREDWENRGNLL